MQFNSITVCLDMFGCPNRCRHCWVGHGANGRLTGDDLRCVAAQFRPYTKQLQVYDWYREPDYADDYRALWDLCLSLSDGPHAHFELVSVWRLARDEAYARWLSTLGLQYAQLTFFGGREKTDLYTGRKGAYDDLITSISRLMENGIAPRIQYFADKNTLGELPQMETLIDELQLDARCRSVGRDFVFFMHGASCAGAGERLYDIRLTPDDLQALPPGLVQRTLKYLGKQTICEVFGQTEQALCAELFEDRSTENLAGLDPVFYIDQDLNVYPNFSAPEPIWYLGNLKTEGIEAVLRAYAENASPAQRTRRTVPLCQMAKAAGNPDSLRLFTRGDYIEYLLNRCSRSV